MLKVVGFARLCADPEVQYAKSGKAYLNMRAACDTGWGENKKACFVDVTVFDKRAESCGEFLRKGSKFFVDGELQMESWEDKKTGERRSKLKIIANEIKFLDAKRDGDAQPAPDRAAPPPVARPLEDDDIPW